VKKRLKNADGAAVVVANGPPLLPKSLVKKRLNPNEKNAEPLRLKNSSDPSLKNASDPPVLKKKNSLDPPALKNEPPKLP